MASSLAFRQEEPFDPQVDRSVPTIYIGLGGTGRDVLLRLRQRIAYAEGFDGDWKHRRFLWLDIDGRAAQPSLDHIEFFELNVEQGERIQCEISESQLKWVRNWRETRGDRRFSWMSDRLFQYTHHMFEYGSGAIRQFGRLAFQLKQEVITKQIVSHIEAVGSYAGNHPGRIANDRLEIVLVTSLAGGAGSGMFIDLAFLLRSLFPYGGFTYDFSEPNTTLVALLPGVFQRLDLNCADYFKLNAFASLCDIEKHSTRFVDPLQTDDLSDGENTIEFLPPWSQDPIRGQPWQHCHLIDDVNPAHLLRPLDYAEITQMIADFLFTSGERSRLAMAVRDQLSMHEVNQNRRFAEQIADPDVGSGQEQSFSIPHGCGCSSFGISEIHWDTDRIELLAAGHLADRILALARRGSDALRSAIQVQEMARSDLLSVAAPAAEACKQSFDPEQMWRQYLVMDDVDWISRIDASFDALRKSEGELTSEAILAAIEDWTARLTGPSEVSTLMQVRSKDLGGHPSAWGHYRSRLRQLVSSRFEALGCRDVIELLREYESAFKQVEKRVSRWMSESLPDPQSLVLELHDAELLPRFSVWNSRRRAIAKWFPQACERARRYVLEFYRAQVCGRYLAPLVKDLIEQVTTDDQRPLMPGHPASQSEFRRLNEFLDELQQRNQAWTQRLANQNDSRTVQLIPDWNAEAYVWRIREACVDNGLHHHHGDTRWNVFLRSELKKFMCSRNHRSRDDLDALFDAVCETNRDWDCFHKQFLRHVREFLFPMIDTSQFRSQLQLSTVGKESEPFQRSGMVAQLVTRSQPYLPLAPSVREFSVASHYGALSVMGIGDRIELGQACQMWNHELAAGLPRIDEINPMAWEETRKRVVLVRMLTGVPLAYYPRLAEFQQAYENERHCDQVVTSRLDDRDREIPPILLLAERERNDIRVARHLIPLALALGWIIDDSGRLFIRISDRFGLGDRFYLGRTTMAAILSACPLSYFRDDLTNRWSQWRVTAKVAQRVGLLASLHLTRDHLLSMAGPLGEFTLETQSLLGCYNKAIAIVDQDLAAAGVEGEAWRGRFIPDDPRTVPDADPTLARRVLNYVRDQCLIQPNPRWHVWRLNPDGKPIRLEDVLGESANAPGA